VAERIRQQSLGQGVARDDLWQDYRIIQDQRGARDYYFDYDIRNSEEFDTIKYYDSDSELKMKNIVVVADKYDPIFFAKFGHSYYTSDKGCYIFKDRRDLNGYHRNRYNFEGYQFTDKIVYEEINLNDINDIDKIDWSEILVKSTRYNYSEYSNFYKMVPYNKYFKVLK